MNSWLDPVRWLLFLALWRMSYDTANIRSPTASMASCLIQREADPASEAATPPEQEWADKAIRKYAAVQDKKWQRWNEAMFERY